MHERWKILPRRRQGRKGIVGAALCGRPEQATTQGCPSSRQIIIATYGASKRYSAVTERSPSVTTTEAFQSVRPLGQRTITPLP